MRRSIAVLGLCLISFVAGAMMQRLYDRRGLVSVASVLGSLYPVVTVLLARFLLQERLLLIQSVGVVLSLVGVAVIAV